MYYLQLVELKNGVTFNGHLVECDNFMNVTLREVYQTSADGERFFKMKEMFIKGNIVSSPGISSIYNIADMTDQILQNSRCDPRSGGRGAGEAAGANTGKRRIKRWCVDVSLASAAAFVEFWCCVS